MADLAGNLERLEPGHAPAAPANPPATAALLAASRRQLSTESTTSSSGVTAGAPVVTLTDHVIHGTVAASDADSEPLSYVVVGTPTDNSDVVLDSATGAFAYLPNATLLASRGTGHFDVMVMETPSWAAALEGVPVVGGEVQPVLVALHRVPVLGKLLTPVIGAAAIEPVDVDIQTVVPDPDTSVARTITMTSYDGTKINVHFFPAADLDETTTAAPTVIFGPGLGYAGQTDPNEPWTLFGGVADLRSAGYNVVTWDPRGEFGSGGQLNLDAPDVEGRDMSTMIDLIAAQPEAQLDLDSGIPNDPRVGMIGGSLGGGIQLVTAATDHRIDAIVPGIAWHSLTTALYENGAFKTSYASLLVLGELEVGATLIPQLYTGILTGDLTGMLTQAQYDLLAARDPDVAGITAPTLLLQGTVDTLFPLDEAQANAQILAGNVPTAMLWFCGGHGSCLTSADPDLVYGSEFDGNALIRKDTLAWLDRYLKQDPDAAAVPTFEWVDQYGKYYTSNLLPSDPAFQGTPIVITGAGGILPIVPIIGGSGPQSLSGLPLTDGTKANIALNTAIPASDSPVQIVGAPQLTITYSGIGTSHDVYAQLVDTKTGYVVGNVVTPIPVTLNGQSQTVTVPLEEIAYTMEPDDSLTLQLVGSATSYEDFTSVGVINVSSVALTLPTVGAGADVQDDTWADTNANDLSV